MSSAMPGLIPDYNKPMITLFCDSNCFYCFFFFFFPFFSLVFSAGRPFFGEGADYVMNHSNGPRIGTEGDQFPALVAAIIRLTSTSNDPPIEHLLNTISTSLPGDEFSTNWPNLNCCASPERGNGAAMFLDMKPPDGSWRPISDADSNQLQSDGVTTQRARGRCHRVASPH